MDGSARHILQAVLPQCVLDQFFLIDEGRDHADRLVLMQCGIPDDLFRFPVSRVFDLTGAAFDVYIDKRLRLGAAGTDLQF